MKQLVKKFLFFSMVFATILSCSDDFLNPERNTNSLTDDDLTGSNISPEAQATGLLNGLYNYMIQRNGLGLASARHNDFGHKGLDIWTDMLAGDMALSTNTYGWYRDTSNLSFTQNFTQLENRIAWTYLYRVISVANSLIKNFGENSDFASLTDSQKAALGQAKAMRAYGYFYLAQLYQREYNPSQPILPYYTSDDAEKSLAKVPASQIYSLIVRDLNDAITLLDNYNRSAKHFVNKWVAKGLLAYTYAAMGNNPMVKTLSEEIITLSGHTLTDAGQLVHPGAGSGFNNLNTPSWMWGYDLTAALDINLISWWGQVDYFSYSYAAVGDNKAMDRLLFDSMPMNDIRRNQFHHTGAPAANRLQPFGKFFAPARTHFGQNPMETDYIYMRVDEFYLLSAEASAKTGDEFTAKNRMKDLLSSRLGGLANAEAYIDPLTGNGLQDAIYHQTRLELWGEGKIYFAMKRNQKTIQRGANHAFLPNISVPYNDRRLTFQIPEIELNNNPNITDQN
jgi:hypothetical protein